VPAAIVVLLCCLAMVCWWTRRRQVQLRRADVNNWLRNMSMSTVVFQPKARKARPAIQTSAMVTVTADPGPEPAFAATVPKAQLWIRARAHDLQLWREGPVVLEARAGTAGAGCESGEQPQSAPSCVLHVTCWAGDTRGYWSAGHLLHLCLSLSGQVVRSAQLFGYNRSWILVATCVALRELRA
jgi:hypothetical protein